MQLFTTPNTFPRSKKQTFKTIIFTFSILGAHLLTPNESKAQEKDVVVGYGTVKKSNQTGAITEVNVNDIAKAPVYSIADALGGRAAGLQVSAADGQPGAAKNILIRNINSLSQKNAPLFVVDGSIVPNFDLASLNPEDIEVLNILKDAAATTIFGANAINGVVLITTKRGQAGKPVISFQNAVGFQEVTKKMDMMTPYEFVKYQMELNPQSSPSVYFKDGRTLSFYEGKEGIDWQDLIFRRSLVRTHQLSLRGGTAKTKYAISGSNFEQNGVLANSNASRYQARIAIDQVITKNLTVGINTNFSRLSNSGQIVADPSNSFLNRVWSSRPVAGSDLDLINSDYDEEVRSYLKAVNPIITNKNENRKDATKDLLANAYLNYSITKNLTFRSTGSYLNSKNERSQFNNAKSYLGSPLGPTRGSRGINGSLYEYKRNPWVNDNTLSYQNNFAEKHELSILGGFGIAGNKNTDENHTYNYIPHDDAAMEEGIMSSWGITQSAFKSKSYFGRLFYGYQSRYLLEGSYRADQHYKIFNHHSSIAFAWNMHEESFLKNVTALSTSKLRMSYGKQKGSIIVDQLNIGYDLGLFKNRITLSVDAYKKTIENMNFFRWFEPGHMNGLTLTTNKFSTDQLENKGLEFNLNTVNLRSSSFSWQTNFNITFGKNKILKLLGGEEYRSSGIMFGGGYNDLYEARVGNSAGAMTGLIFDGVYQYHDFDKSTSGMYTLKNNIPDINIFQIQPGDIKYKDVNGDGQIDIKDMVVIGGGVPLHTGGFTNNFTYKNFDLNVFFQWSYGNDIYNGNRYYFDGNGRGNIDRNQFSSYVNRWTPENQTNEHQRADARERFNSSRLVEDGSYLRLKTASFAYNFSKSQITKLHLSALQFHITAQNLLTFTKYSGMDPEVSVANNVLTPGLDLSAYPQARTLVFGINASF